MLVLPYIAGISRPVVRRFFGGTSGHGFSFSNFITVNK